MVGVNWNDKQETPTTITTTNWQKIKLREYLMLTNPKKKTGFIWLSHTGLF